MHVTWHGLDCLKIQAKEGTVLLDPFSGNVGLTAPRLQADLFLFTDPTNPQIPTAEKNNGFVIARAGEYEYRSILIHGAQVDPAQGSKGESRTIFQVTAEGVALGVLGALNRPLTDAELERLENVDVLFLPVGGHGVLTAKQATEVLSQIEPRIAVPYYYAVPKLKKSLDGPEAFKREVGAKGTTPEPKLRLTKKDLPEEEMRVVFLSL